MVKAKLRRKAERAERAGKALARSSGGGGAKAEDGLGDDAAAGAVEDEMSRLTDHHRRKVKKRAAFLESAYKCVGLRSFRSGFVRTSGRGAGVEDRGMID